MKSLNKKSLNKNRWRQQVMIMLAVTVMLFVPLPASAKESSKIVILHTNDVHCSVEQVTDKETGEITNIGYAGVAAYKKEMEQMYGEDQVTLVDAGDAIQGSAIGTLSDGSYPVDIMNQVGYDFAIPGNHEFDFGMEQFMKLVKDNAKYTYLSSNFMDAAGNQVLDAYSVVNYGDKKVAYIGISTPDTITKSTPIFFQDKSGNYIYSFCEDESGQALYENVQTSVDAAREEGADYVVAIGHLGENGASKVWTSDAVIANTKGIDLLIDGHSHEQYSKKVKNADGEEVLLVQTGTKLMEIGRIEIDTKNGDITSEMVSGDVGTDPDTKAYIDTILLKLQNILQEEVGQSDVVVSTLSPETGERAVRRAETSMGDFCADAYRVMLDADIAFINGGGIRADIDKGPVTYEEIINVHPYGNQLCLVEVKGQAIIDALELGAAGYPEESGSFLQVSGLTYGINEAIPSSVVLNEKQEFVKVDGDYRVTDVMVNDQPLDLNKTYKLASHDYILKHGGNGFTMFKDSKMILDEVMVDNQALIRYITEKLSGKIGKEYEDPKGQGRIVLTEAADKTADKTASESADKTADKTASESADKTADKAAAESADKTAAEGENKTAKGSYEVKAGDCLYRIAVVQYGDGTQWRIIYESNKDTVKNPRLIYVGQILTLPAAGTAVQ